MSELMACICLGKRERALGNPAARKNFFAILVFESLNVQAQRFSQRMIQNNQLWRPYRCWIQGREKQFRQMRIAVV
jgi:hypothetical protein